MHFALAPVAIDSTEGSGSAVLLSVAAPGSTSVLNVAAPTPLAAGAGALNVDAQDKAVSRLKLASEGDSVLLTSRYVVAVRGTLGPKSVKSEWRFAIATVDHVVETRGSTMVSISTVGAKAGVYRVTGGNVEDLKVRR